MQTRIVHPMFQNQVLSYSSPGLFTAGSLYLNDQKLVRNAGKYSALSDSGYEMVLTFRPVFFDPVPRITIGADTLVLAKPYVWYQYLFICSPLLLLLAVGGGALGGLLGALGSVLNGRIFRANMSEPLKYVASMLIATTAFVLFIIVVVILIALGLISGPKTGIGSAG